MKNRGIIFLLLGFGVGTSTIFSETKNDHEIFAKWIDWQRVFSDGDVSTMAGRLNAQYVTSFSKKYTKHAARIKPLVPFFTRWTEGFVDQEGSLKLQQNFSPDGSLFASLEHNPADFITKLRQNNFIHAQTNEEEQAAEVEATIKKHKVFMRLLFAQEDSERRKAYLFAVANRLFEFCYGPETFAGFKPMLHNTPEYPIVRLLYSTMWHYLVGDGWKHWHNTCLDGLKKEVDSGKRVSYIAGGNDIYQLLKLGIYAIDVIDPMLPSQPEYYAEGWDWLIKKDGLGDEIMIDFPDKKLVMKRISYSEQGAFDAKLSTGITESLPLSKTTWHVFDRSNQKKLGSIVFDRRFCNQQDFIAHDKRALLISFNEMYFVAAPESLNGWGINLEKISPEMPIFIKQLRKPISRQVLLNLREAETSPFYFILLGSCPT